MLLLNQVDLVSSVLLLNQVDLVSVRLPCFDCQRCMCSTTLARAACLSSNFEHFGA